MIDRCVRPIIKERLKIDTNKDSRSIPLPLRGRSLTDVISEDSTVVTVLLTPEGKRPGLDMES